jgi:hypothetical protein
MTTEITHIKVDSQESANCYARMLVNEWQVLTKPLGNGSNDAKLTGGNWLYKGDEKEAREMQAKRWEEVKKWSDNYYAQRWV